MFDVVNTSESLPLVSLLPPAGSLTPVDFPDVSYSPAFLLPVQFDASIMTDPEYQRACEVGFDDYVERLYEADERAFFTWDEVKNEVVRTLLDVQKVLPPGFPTLSLAWASGFLLGWLSALALINRPLALSGLELLTVLIAYREKAIA